MMSCEIPVHASQCGDEQSLNIAAGICERSVFLEKGQVRFEGATRYLMSRDDIARAVFLGSQHPQER
jgi:ABC-type lipopolysaccharide export system ATPase subunit